MAQLTLSFKGRPLFVHRLSDRPVTIGRDANCDIPIDSLAVGPDHARITAHADGYSIEARDAEYPILLNNEQVTQAALHDGDLIRIGKHSLHYAAAGARTEVLDTATRAAVGRGTASELAYIQVQSGPDLGRVFALDGDSTRLTQAGADRLVITRSEGVYFLTCEDPRLELGVNGQPAQPMTWIPLADATLIQAGGLRCQFFCRTLHPSRGPS
jgi:hypothetical protein